jgi:quinol monooxygenase YgiN
LTWLQDQGDATHVVLNEVYLEQAAADSHKQTVR